MKPFILFILSLILFTGCQQNEEPEIQQETGVVVNYAGAEHCSIVIELDNGQKIQPLNYPEGFVFIQGQRLLLNYTVLPNIISTCGKGTVCEILSIEELECGSPVTEIVPEDYSSFPNDPLTIHDISIDGECLYLRVSYSGGCQNHSFNLVRADEEHSDEDTPVLELRHDANGDLCEAALSMELRFNLSTLKDEGYKQFIFKALLENEETYSEMFAIEI